MKPTLIISGGQTGADRGGLDAAIALGIPHGGWCPNRRRAEDGQIPKQYVLRETASRGYSDRTLRNVAYSNATIVFVRWHLTPGSRETVELAKDIWRPCEVFKLDTYAKGYERAGATLENRTVLAVRSFLVLHAPHVLNVAGSRESKCPGIQNMVRDILVAAICGAPMQTGGVAGGGTYKTGKSE